MSYAVTVVCPGEKPLHLPGVPGSNPNIAMIEVLRRLPSSLRGKTASEVTLQEQDGFGNNLGNPTILKDYKFPA